MSYTILQGDWIEQLRTLSDESVQMCVTSPPYFGLREVDATSRQDCSSKHPFHLSPRASS